MSSTALQIPWPLGTTLWYTRTVTSAVHTKCPVCAGTGEINIEVRELYETWRIACPKCQEYGMADKGTGRIASHTYEFIPETFVPDGVEASSTRGVTYYSGNGGRGVNGLFATREECLVECARRKADAEGLRQKQDLLSMQSSMARKISASIRYWTAKRNELRADLALVEARVAELKEKP